MLRDSGEPGYNTIPSHRSYSDFLSAQPWTVIALLRVAGPLTQLVRHWRAA